MAIGSSLTDAIDLERVLAEQWIAAQSPPP
jgi:hypothetical protein